MEKVQEPLQKISAQAISPQSKTGQKIEKIIVAVHGIGDQTSYATIQSTLFQFCQVYGAPAAVPLGNFHTKTGWLNLTHPPYPEGLSRLAFTEVYWANIPRQNAQEHTLEDAQKWARTIVERVRQRNNEAKQKQAEVAKQLAASKTGNEKTTPPNGETWILKEEDFPMLEQVLKEMLQTVGVLDRLCFLAEKAGVFSFDLNKVLVDYLDDVQVVTEFATLRRDIIEAFDKIMRKVHKNNKEADIYIVAHSEGTVVSFLGLLAAMCSDETPAWVKKVRGLMTIGSPIDKHLTLWPELFQDYKQPQWEPDEPTIEWRNYYDRGDPVGFNLDAIRNWIKGNWGDFTYKWQAFNFEEQHDFGFTRYPLPGKAHNDYWTDEAVFGHFIKTVVSPELLAQGDDKQPCDFSKPPADNVWAKCVSYLLPYSLATVLLFLAVFILYKGITAYLSPSAESESTGMIFIKVIAYTMLLAGLTVLTRIPRLTRKWRWRLFGVGFFIATTIGYQFIRSKVLGIEGLGKLIITATVIAIVIILVNLFYMIQGLFPPIGIKLLLTLGGLSIGAIVIKNIWENQNDPGPLWPLLLATSAFLYLWWLVALLFDLTFIWHSYIHNSEIMNCLQGICKTEHRMSKKLQNLQQQTY